jgi:hypothetical protein
MKEVKSGGIAVLDKWGKSNSPRSHRYAKRCGRGQLFLAVTRTGRKCAMHSDAVFGRAVTSALSAEGKTQKEFDK